MERERKHEGSGKRVGHLNNNAGDDQERKGGANSSIDPQSWRSWARVGTRSVQGSNQEARFGPKIAGSSGKRGEGTLDEWKICM